MKEYLITTMLCGEHGLYLCELPTGYGKTYNVVHAIKEYLANPDNHRKIIYLTTLNKNLPEKELLSAFDNNEAAYRKNVLRIRSNFDEVTEKLENLAVPEEFQTDRYDQLYGLVQRYNRAMASKVTDQDYIQDIKNRLNDAESAFRVEITRKLKHNFSNKQARLKAIRTNSNWKWIGQLYPAVFTDDHQILLMSISKFMKKNSCLVEPSYEFLESDLIKDAIIFIDEFDATKATMEEAITEGALSIQEDYLSLFRQILRGLNPKYLSRTMRDAYQNLDAKASAQFTFEKILKEAQEIEEKYAVYLSYKTAEESVDRKQNFLLKDATYHTLFHDNKGYIRATKNADENRIDIFFETRKEFYAHVKENKEENIVVYALLREINRFLIHFRTFLFEWARHYMHEINARRNPEDDELTLENAISTILDKFELSRAGQQLILSEMRSPSVNRKQKELLPDNRFYQQGMEIFELEDQDSHHDSTNLRLVAVYDTPEKILTYLSGKASVIGISATAEIPSVVGNYDLGYLKEKLGDQFHLTPNDTKTKIAAQLKKVWKAYDDGLVQIHAEMVKNEEVNFDALSVCREIFHNEESAGICANLIRNTVEKDYYALRYCNIVRAMHLFCSVEIQSMLYLGMALPKRNNPELDEELLKKLFRLVIKDVKASDCAEDHTLSIEPSLCILRSRNFDEDKAALLDRLGAGDKVFIMSSYPTLVTGQNMQYKASDKNRLVELVPYLNDGDQRHFYKDIDAIYLGDITNLTANTYSEKKLTEQELLGMLFQIEELKENDELNYTEADNMIKLAFRAYTGHGHMERNVLYQTESVRLQATRLVMQAVGRICRTYLKAPDIYIYIEEQLLEKLSAGELKKHILPPEMQAIVKLRETLGTEYSNDEARILTRAENISSRGMWTIRQNLSRNWTEDSMALWRNLRMTTLCHPTADAELHDTDELIHKLYITSGKVQNRYFYSQYSDFSSVTVDFGNDAIAFRNSGRAKQKADSGEVAVYEMSEAESGLPVILQYPGMEELFTESGYATEFQKNDYMMSPVLFHNIYKGALGKVAGKFILKQELGVEMTEITEPEKFEFFDYQMARDAYVDFKNWKFSYLVDRDSVKKEILRKLDAIGGKRAYIINIIGDSDANIAPTPIDARIIEIPCLIDRHGRPLTKCLSMIREEDIR